MSCHTHSQPISFLKGNQKRFDPLKSIVFELHSCSSRKITSLETNLLSVPWKYWVNISKSILLGSVMVESSLLFLGWHKHHASALPKLGNYQLPCKGPYFGNGLTLFVYLTLIVINHAIIAKSSTWAPHY
jgi:hypothetical protein